jgi:hypothetical protein
MVPGLSDTAASFSIEVMCANRRRLLDDLRRAMTTPDFRPLLGFREFEHTYLSDEFFPLFQQRVMNPRRSDYERYIRSLNLPFDSTPWEQLARSGGKRTGDTIQLFPEPVVRVDDSSRCCFLVHGVRHIETSYNPSVQQRINDLHKGDSLQLVPEPDNMVNPRALLTSTEQPFAGPGWEFA